MLWGQKLTLTCKQKDGHHPLGMQVQLKCLRFSCGSWSLNHDPGHAVMRTRCDLHSFSYISSHGHAAKVPLPKTNGRHEKCCWLLLCAQAYSDTCMISCSGPTLTLTCRLRRTPISTQPRSQGQRVWNLAGGHSNPNLSCVTT